MIASVIISIILLVLLIVGTYYMGKYTINLMYPNDKDDDVPFYIKFIMGLLIWCVLFFFFGVFLEILKFIYPLIK